MYDSVAGELGNFPVVFVFKVLKITLKCGYVVLCYFQMCYVSETSFVAGKYIFLLMVVVLCTIFHCITCFFVSKCGDTFIFKEGQM